MRLKSLNILDKHWLLIVCLVASFALYQWILVSDRYVSEANVVLESPQIAPTTLDFSTLLTGGGAANTDMLLFRDHLLSYDMMRKVVEQLPFREHFSDPTQDFFSRLSDIEAPQEDLHEYYLRRVSVELDDYAQVLRIKVEAFTPDMAHSMATLLLNEGERHMNEMGQRLGDEQVKFLERQVDELFTRFELARKALIEYQNEHGLVSPSGTVESLSAIIAGMEGELASLKAERSALASFQRENSPQLVKVEAAINSLTEQIQQERSRLAQRSGNALNAVSAEYQSLELKAAFAQESYSGVLAALENTRIEAARKLKQVSVLQNPTFPEYPVLPDRLYNSVVFAVIAVFLGLIGQMLLLIIRDHGD